jgi:hypothetical protein
MTRTTFMIATLLLLLVGAGAAQDNTTTRQAMRAKAVRAFTEGKTVYGKVSAIDDEKIVIENPYGAKKEIKLDSKTKFRNAKNKTFKLTDITPGLMVKVTFREADLTATTVQEDAKK